VNGRVSNAIASYCRKQTRTKEGFRGLKKVVKREYMSLPWTQKGMFIAALPGRDAIAVGGRK